MDLSGSYVIPEGDSLLIISSYNDLYEKIDLNIFSDLSNKGRNILEKNLKDAESRKYIERYLSNKQVETYNDGEINIYRLMTMLDKVSRKDISEKVGLSTASLSKVARGWRNTNPDKRDIQVTELRNIRFDTILKLSHYYHRYYLGESKLSGKVKTVVVGEIYSCQNCGFNVSGSRYCPNCGTKINY